MRLVAQQWLWGAVPSLLVAASQVVWVFRRGTGSCVPLEGISFNWIGMTIIMTCAPVPWPRRAMQRTCRHHRRFVRWFAVASTVPMPCGMSNAATTTTTTSGPGHVSAYAKQPKPDPGVSLSWLVKLVFTGLVDRSADRSQQPGTTGTWAAEEKLAKRTDRKGEHQNGSQTDLGETRLTDPTSNMP
uniref:Uncharacterized protein n=1 Tax=Anopheles darlingi TaxID=43151 RepID=A0A2M4DHD1_ANODA